MFTAWPIIFAQVQGSRGASPPSFSPCDKLFCCRSIHVHQPKYSMRESTCCLLSEQSDFYVLQHLHHIHAKLCVQPCSFIRHLSQLSAVQVGCPACSNVSRLLLSNFSSQPSHEPLSPWSNHHYQGLNVKAILFSPIIISNVCISV